MDAQPLHVEVVLLVVEAVLDRVLGAVEDPQGVHGVLERGAEDAEEPGVALPALLDLGSRRR